MCGRRYRLQLQLLTVLVSGQISGHNTSGHTKLRSLQTRATASRLYASDKLCLSSSLHTSCLLEHNTLLKLGYFTHVFNLTALTVSRITTVSRWTAKMSITKFISEQPWNSVTIFPSVPKSWHWVTTQKTLWYEESKWINSRAMANYVFCEVTVTWLLVPNLMKFLHGFPELSQDIQELKQTHKSGRQ